MIFQVDLNLPDRTVPVEVYCEISYPNRAWLDPGAVTIERVRQEYPRDFIGPRQEWTDAIPGKLLDHLAEICFERALDN